MSDKYYSDVREFIDVLDKRGLKSGGTKRCRHWRSKTLVRLHVGLVGRWGRRDGGSGGARRAGHHA